MVVPCRTVREQSTGGLRSASSRPRSRAMSKNRATALNGHFTNTSEIGEAATFVGLAPIANPCIIEIVM